MIYVLACPRFATDLGLAIARFRAAHEPERAALVPAHVTVVFGLRDANRRQLTDAASRISGTVAAMDVAFDRGAVVHDAFEKTHKLTLMVSDGQSALTALHETLSHALGAEPVRPYRPHMTVATDRDRRVLDQLDVARIGTFPMAARIDALDVVELVDGRLDVLHHAALGA